MKIYDDQRLSENESDEDDEQRLNSENYKKILVHASDNSTNLQFHDVDKNDYIIDHFNNDLTIEMKANRLKKYNKKKMQKSKTSPQIMF